MLKLSLKGKGNGTSMEDACCVAQSRGNFASGTYNRRRSLIFNVVGYKQHSVRSGHLLLLQFPRTHHGNDVLFSLSLPICHRVTSNTKNRQSFAFAFMGKATGHWRGIFASIHFLVG
ncbi:hypothetical protein TNCV_4355021 [Trichonephila clavipes]|nr:hypothetical protein TNCV_4355021 [Trichonephila clavipes]